jgi:integrase
VSEIIGVKLGDTVLVGAPFVHLHGKGRKQRTVPLWRSTVSDRARLRLNPDLAPIRPYRLTGAASRRAPTSRSAWRWR